MEQSLTTANITSESIYTVEEFLTLRDDWQSLLEQSTQNSLFLSWEWHFSWWECFATSSDSLQIVVLKSDDKIIGLAPLYYQSSTLLGKTLRFIGTGEPEADEVVTEYLDFIVLPGYEQTLIDTMHDWLIKQKNWQRIELNYVLGNYLSAQVVERLQHNFCMQSRLIGKAYSTPLESSETEYRESRLSASRNKRLKRCLKALDKDGGGLVRTTIQTAAEITTHLQTLKILHDERWASKKESSIFESQRFLAFHQKLLTLLIPQDRASISVYSLNDKPIAALYVMYSKNNCHYYQSGFTKEGENRYMPLFVSHIMEMNAARDRGLANYDFMRGGANSYKSDFGCQENDMFDIVIYRYRFESTLRNVRIKLRNFYTSVIGKTVALAKSVKQK